MNDKIKVECKQIKQKQCLLKDYLLSRKVIIKRKPEEDKSDEILNRISIFIENRYNLIDHFLSKLNIK